jgi:hypothetical protein
MFNKTSEVACKALGWSLRYFMVLRDNYFGSFTHFSTLVEYLDKRSKFPLSGDPLEMKHRPNKVGAAGSFLLDIALKDKI